MQMNRWLTYVEPEDEEPSEEASHSPVRPRASVWIDPMAQQNISASYIAKGRHVIPNPQTPIPPRASAQHASHSIKVRPRYARNYTRSQDSDITRTPTLPQPTMWQYELPDYDAESSLSSLSLAYPEAAVDRALDELDTLPPPRSRAIADIDEIDTLPPPKQNTFAAQKSVATIERKNVKGNMFSFPFAQSGKPQRQKSVTLPAPRSLSEIATVPPGAATVAVPRVPTENMKLGLFAGVRTPATLVEARSTKHMEEAASWTTGQGKNSSLAKRVASRGPRKSSLSHNPIDRLRWWLLYPGRIEFLLWLNGTIVLVGVTCLLLFATLLSTGWLNAGFSSIAVGVGGRTIQTSSIPGSTSTSGKISCNASNASSPQCHPTTVISSGLQLTHIDNGLLLSDSQIYLYGQDFSTNNTVTFTYDAQVPCRPGAIQTNTQGSFFVSLTLEPGVQAGMHTIVAQDVASSRSISVEVSIAPAPFGRAVPPTPTHVAPGVTPTATSGAGGGVLPTPVGQTPIPITPTVAVTPTTVPTQQPTPTVGITPSPTIGVTPTVGITPTIAPTKTPIGGKPHTSSASLLKNALYDQPINTHVSVSLWLWIAVIGYTLSMLMLGCAGLLYRRNRRLSSK
ncbi:MAG: hypothetical protein NVSMB54_28900 [Ktedonobacteraceae bacterium]